MIFQGRVVLRILVGLLISLSATAFATEHEAVPGEYIVKLKPSAIKAKATALQAQLNAEIIEQMPNQNLVVIKRNPAEKSAFVIKSISQNPMVEYIEPNYIYRINRTPNDPKMEELWGMHNFGQKDSRGQEGVVGADVGAVKAWDIETGSKDIIIAVIDTGIDPKLDDLQENMWVNEAEANGKAGVDDDENGFVDDIHGYDFVNNDGDPTDDHGHGSHCSGTIAARGNDGKGIVGVAWEARLMGVKFLSKSGSGTLANAVKAIDYATQMGAHIQSNSWGGGGFSQALKEAIERSHEKGGLFVAAAGNHRANNDERPSYPASYEVPNVMSIAAVDNRGSLASFSCFGPRTVHVGAPGVNVVSTTPGGYQSWSGTSMATPHVSGIAALLMSHDPKLTAVEIKERIIATASPFEGLTDKVKAGGMANAFNALTNKTPPPDPNNPEAWPSKAVSISSAHPYPNDAREEFEVSVPGAEKMAIHFSRFETERNYDKLAIFDKEGNLLAELSGSHDNSWSVIIPGDSAKLVFTSDRSVNKYGFDIDKVAYKEPSSEELVSKR